MRAWRARSSLRDPRDFEPWLAAIVRNEAARVMARARPAPVDPDQAPELSGGDPELRASELRLDLAASLARLDEVDRLIVRLRYELDLTQPAIARLLGMPEGTVKVRLHRARSKLRQLLKET